MANHKRLKLSIVVLFILLLSFCLFVIHKKNNKKNTSITVESTSTISNASEDNEKAEKTVISYSTDESLYSSMTYDDLLQKLNDISSKKNLDDVEFAYAKTILDNLYANYDDWRECSKDFPSKEKYIYENLFEPLNNCMLNFISTESDEGQRMLNAGSAFGFTERFGGKTKVTILYEPDEEKSDYLLSAGRFLHELAHVSQMPILFNDTHFKDYPYLSYIVTEGGATFKMKMMNQCLARKMAANFTSHGDISLEYKLDNGDGYPKEMNYYCHLQYLAGYDVLEGVIKGDSASNIEARIAERYDTETAKRIFSLLGSIETADLEENNKEELQYELELENLFLECVKKDISQLKTKEDVEAFTNIYRAYMIHLLPGIYLETHEDITYIDVTHEPGHLSKAKEIDEYMADKICEFNAFGIDNTITADSLLHTSTDYVYESPDDFQWAFVPTNLYKTKFMEKEDGSLVLGYYDNNFEDESGYNYLLIRKDRIHSDVFTDLLYEGIDIDPNDLQYFY
ncbi:MAG: hypothetical protein IKS39_02365 [Clostridia bacterium]|nr:hypothetical protein [Clostridia bacterium]